MKDFLSILFFSNLSIIENIKQLKNLQIQKTTWDKIFVNFIKSKSYKKLKNKCHWLKSEIV